MAHKTKVTPVEKVMLVKKYLAGAISSTEASEIVRVDNEFFRDWVHIYKQEVSLGLVNDGSNRRYSRELATIAVEAYLYGEGSQSEICKNTKSGQELN